MTFDLSRNLLHVCPEKKMTMAQHCGVGPLFSCVEVVGTGSIATGTVSSKPLEPAEPPDAPEPSEAREPSEAPDAPEPSEAPDPVEFALQQNHFSSRQLLICCVTELTSGNRMSQCLEDKHQHTQTHKPTHTSTP